MVPTQIIVDDIEPLDKDGQLITYDTPIFNETWGRMEKIYDSGRAKAIGVSNFSIKKYASSSLRLHCRFIVACSLERLLETAKVVPAVNQVEYALRSVHLCGIFG